VKPETTETEESSDLQDKFSLYLPYDESGGVIGEKDEDDDSARFLEVPAEEQA